jgi:hypothetical protein
MRKKQAYGPGRHTEVDYGLLQAPGNPYCESTARRFLGAICDAGFGVRSDPSRGAPLSATPEWMPSSRPAFLPGAKGNVQGRMVRYIRGRKGWQRYDGAGHRQLRRAPETWFSRTLARTRSKDIPLRGRIQSIFNMMHVESSLFGVPRALIGVIHVGALPGSPSNRKTVAVIADQEVRTT